MRRDKRLFGAMSCRHKRLACACKPLWGRQQTCCQADVAYLRNFGRCAARLQGDSPVTLSPASLSEEFPQMRCQVAR